MPAHIKWFVLALIFHVLNGPIFLFQIMMMMMIGKLNANKLIHFHHRSFQAKPTLTQKKKIQLYRWLCANVRRKRNAKLDTTLSNCKWEKQQHSFKIDALHTHTHHTYTTSKQFKFVHHFGFFFFCFVLFWKKWILVGNFHATNRQFHSFRIGLASF